MQKFLSICWIRVELITRIFLFFTAFLFATPSCSQEPTQTPADSIYTIGMEFSQQDLHERAIENYYSAIRLYKNEKNKEGLIKSYNSLGLSFHKINNEKNATLFFNRALRELKENPDEKLSSYVFNNLGMVKEAAGQIDSARFFYERSLSIKESLRDSAGMARTLNNLGIIRLKEKKYRESLNFNFASLEIKKNLGDTTGMAISNMNIANLYGYLGKLDSVRHFLDKGIIRAQSPNLLSNFYKNYSEYYRALGKFDSALVYSDSIVLVNNQIFDEQMTSEIAKHQSLYELEKKDMELKEERLQNSLLKQQEKQEMREKVFFMILALLLSISLVLVYLIYRSNKKASRNRQKVLEKELELKSKEILSNSNLILHKQELLNELKTLLSTYQEKYHDLPSDLFSEIESKFRKDLNKQYDWEKFKIHFEQIHEGFFQTLDQEFPHLTENDMRHCAYIRIGLSTKEIASMLNINPTSVQRSRVRLKKKLELEKEDDLYRFVKKEI